MSKTITSYKLFVSCPSDVEAYLDSIQTAITSFNHGFGNLNDISIDVIHWRKDVFSNIEKGGSSEGEIIKQALEKTDMLIGIFWTRFGMPTEKYKSGTEEEIDYMLGERKPVSLYFLDKPVSPSKIDTKQLKKIKDFMKKHQKDGIYTILENEMDLAFRLKDDFEKRFSELLKDSSNKPVEDDSQAKTILWVDDRPENNVYGREIFENNGIEVIPALSTKQALDILSIKTVSVIISDMGRKEGQREGYVLLDKLRSEGNKTPFIIFASSRAREHIEETIKHGGQGCTNDFSELFRMVSAIMLGTFVKQSY